MSLDPAQVDDRMLTPLVKRCRACNKPLRQVYPPQPWYHEACLTKLERLARERSMNPHRFDPDAAVKIFKPLVPLLIEDWVELPSGHIRITFSTEAPLVENPGPIFSPGKRITTDVILADPGSAPGSCPPFEESSEDDDPLPPAPAAAKGRRALDDLNLDQAEEAFWAYWHEKAPVSPSKMKAAGRAWYAAVRWARGQT